jgi:phosphopantothenoylcysteine decarboxylase/phosphopantothenate--cysteine ligase
VCYLGYFIYLCTSAVKPVGHLFNRNILLGVSGGIAAYKSAELVRQLQQQGASVRVIMTRGAMEFITPLTLQALSGHAVHSELLDAEAERGMGHIELARWADLLLVAPATADLLARLASGRADDLLTTVALATAAPLGVAPAMNQQMWRDTATGDNIATLRQRGVQVLDPDQGEQACGDIGPGRMQEPAAIADWLCGLFDTRELEGVRVVITAGPTREALDPVRFISNHSSGKMGYALARAAADAGAITTLVSGPVNLPVPERVRHIAVESARDMLRECETLLPACDVFIGCAAVADYRPADMATQKIKKGPEQMTLTLVRNPDIIATVAAAEPAPFTVGFAAETHDVLGYARGKLRDKKLDLVLANDVSDSTIGFNSEDNELTAVWTDGQVSLPRASKSQLARAIVTLVAERYSSDNGSR